MTKPSTEFENLLKGRCKCGRPRSMVNDFCCLLCEKGYHTHTKTCRKRSSA